MTKLEKLIYLADYIEPNRKYFEGLKTAREYAKKDLDKAMILVLTNTIEYIKKKWNTSSFNLRGLRIFKVRERRICKLVDLKNSQEIIKISYNTLDDKMGEDIKILDIHEISALADYFLIASGRNINHIQTLADTVEENLSKSGFNIINKEGYSSEVDITRFWFSSNTYIR